MENKKDKQMVSANLDRYLYRECKKKFLDDNLTFTEMLIGALHLYASGALDFTKYKIEISGSII